MTQIDSRIKIKRSTGIGTVPQIGPSNDNRDGSWVDNDIYAGELFLNDPDGRLWIGTSTGVIELAVGSTSGVADTPFTFGSSSGGALIYSSIQPDFGTNENIAQYSSILGGQSNSILGTIEAKWSTIVGGQNNDIVNVSSAHKWNFIGGGFNNTLTTSTGSSIIGGYNSDITSSNYSISGGRNNQITSSNQTLCIGGRYNTVETSSTDSSITGGYNNTITSSTYSSISGGTENTITSFNNVHILGSNITATAADTTYVESLDINGRVQMDSVAGSAGTSGTLTFDLSSGNIFDYFYPGPMELDYSNAAIGTYQFILRGQTTASAVTFATSKWTAPGGTAPTLTATSGAVDIITATYDGSRLNIAVSKNLQDI